MDKHSFPNGKRLVRDTLKPDDNLHYEKFSGGTVKCIEDEIPFDVPNNWEWCRFGSYTLNRDSERKPVSSVQRKKVKKIYDYYGASGVIDQTDSFLFDEELLLIGEDGANLLARTKPIAFLADGKYWVNNHAHCIDSIDKRLLKFICIYINAINLFQYITGSAQPKLNQDNMNKILIPIPPKAEQEKILESIKIILSNINDIDLLKGKLQSNIANAKSKILDLAIRGKLVPQNPNDEPASVLLERIRAEKEELIKQGKIKRDKKESVIFKGDDNSYYQDLPETWELVNFKDCATLISGRDLNKNEYNAESIGIPYITGASNFINENILINRWTTVPKIVSEVNDILITCKGTVGELAINKYGNIHIARQIMAIRIYKNINLEYIKFFLESIVMEIKKTANGLIPGISRDDILSLNIPLPPLAEQKRIVDEIEKIFATLDDIANQVAYQAVHRWLNFAVQKTILVKSVKIFAASRTHCTIR